MKYLCLLILLTFVVSCTQPVQEIEATTTSTNPSQEALHTLFEDAWRFRMENRPVSATFFGVNTYNDRIRDISLEGYESRYRQRLAFRDRLNAIAFDTLDRQDQISYTIFKHHLDGDIGDYEHGNYLFPFNADSGMHQTIARLPSSSPMSTVKDYENYLARINAIETFATQYVALLQAAVDKGYTLPRATLKGFEATFTAHIVEDPTKSVFYTPFRNYPVTVPENERARLTEAGLAAIVEKVIPAYRIMHEFYRDTYLPACRETYGISEVEGGRELYQHLIRKFTTLDLTPEEIHEIGKGEVARIRAEMQEVIESVNFQGDFAAFLEFLRTDPQFYAKTPEELIKKASYLAKKMDAELPRFFSFLPRQPYGVKPVPEHIAPKYTAGRYVPAPAGGTRPGLYWVNTYNLPSRPLYALEALTLHEATPGHHLQIALAKELEDLPTFRNNLYISAFGEGWGLYSEWLGLEAGFYTDPYSNFGRLTYEMWRACRLVVDTGVHALGWTREEVSDYMASNTALSIHEVTTETDRYITWPAQALSYKLGEIKIRELRRKAEASLGDRFDIRTFHDTLLRNGSVTLPILEQEIEAFIEGR